uniref:Transcriptional regulator ycf27 n=1 Tax=Ditylum brightwellii TaxID=49249 RepID=A0A7S4QFY7_9STRA
MLVFYTTICTFILIASSTICTARGGGEGAFVLHRPNNLNVKHLKQNSCTTTTTLQQPPNCSPLHLKTRLRRTCTIVKVSKNNNNNNNKKDVEEYKFTDTEFLRRTKYWVVIVDDEESIRLAVGDYLYDSGYQVTACADADALLEVCATPKSNGELPAVPDCIVSDVRMPGKDGLELLSLLKADERLARVPVVLLTAKSMTQDRIDGFKAGADAYLPKPFNPDELLSIIDNAIKRRQQMTGTDGKLVDLKADMSNIKQILRKNGQGLVRATDVYLTAKDTEVLDLLCRGFTNGEIASERGVSVIGVNRTIQNLYLKTQTRTRTELVRWAIQTGHVAAR